MFAKGHVRLGDVSNVVASDQDFTEQQALSHGVDQQISDNKMFRLDLEKGMKNNRHE